MSQIKKYFHSLIGIISLFSVFTLYAADPDPWANAKTLPASTNAFSIFGKFTWLAKGGLTLLLIIMVVIALIHAIRHLFAGMQKRRDDEQYTGFFGDVIIAFSLVVAALLIASLAWVYGVSVLVPA